MRSIALALALAAAAPGSAQGQAPEQPPVVSLTLEGAIERALAASHRLAEAVARGEAADALAAQRHSATLPRIVAEAGYTRTNHVEAFGVLLPNNQLRIIYPDIPDNYRSRLDMQWPIYTGGRLDALERAARAEAAASVTDIETSRADLRLETTRAYWALVTAREARSVVDESLARTTAHVRDVRNQLEAGLVPPNEVFSAEAQESRQRMLSVQARVARDLAESDLVRLVGLEAGTPINPVSTLEPLSQASPALAAAIEQARRSRPERAAIELRLAAMTERVHAAAAGRKPTIGIGGGIDYARPNPRIFPREETWKHSWDASVNVTWPVFDGGRTRADLAEAAASGRAVQARLNEFDSVLAVEVRQRLAEVSASQAAIDAAEAGVRAATEARRVVGDRFTAGVATSTDLIDAQVALLQASLDRTQAMANARLAEARLSRAVGR
jgi:outer membrane protein TolC